MSRSPFARAALALVFASSARYGCAAEVGGDELEVETTTQALGTSGVLDSSFGQGGKVTTMADVGGGVVGALQADGKIVAAATVQDLVIGNPAIFGMVRYLANGTLDTAFGTKGLVRTYFGDKAANVRAIAIAPDGKILLVGTVSYQVVSSAGAVTQVEALALARYTGTGALDATFGQGGTLIAQLLGKTDRATAVLLQPDGKILVGGSARTLTGGYSAPTATAIARFLPSGAFDTSFGQGGKVIQVLFGAVDSLALEANGNILVAASHSAARFSPSGATLALPASTTLTAVSAAAFTNMTFQRDSKILFGSSVRGMNKHTHIAQMQRYLLDGTTLDSGFTSPPFSYGPQVSNSSTAVQAIAILPSGKFIVAGMARLPLNSPGISAFGLAAVQANGALDPNFGNAGTLQTQFTGRDQATALLVQPDGKLIALGQSGDANGEHYGFSVARYVL